MPTRDKLSYRQLCLSNTGSVIATLAAVSIYLLAWRLPFVDSICCQMLSAGFRPFSSTMESSLKTYLSISATSLFLMLKHPTMFGSGKIIRIIRIRLLHAYDVPVVRYPLLYPLFWNKLDWTRHLSFTGRAGQFLLLLHQHHLPAQRSSVLPLWRTSGPQLSA